MEVEGTKVDGPVRFRTSDTEHWLRAGTTEVRGEVVALPKGSKVLLVNVLPLEDYVAAVLGGESAVRSALATESASPAHGKCALPASGISVAVGMCAASSRPSR